jgi:hypothetical protein
MNKKVWREDKSMMFFVNTAAGKILSLANGKNTLNEILKESFPERIDIGQLTSESLEKVNLFADLEDRFLQSVLFCINMWERGLLQFTHNQSTQEEMALSSLLKIAEIEDGEIEVLDIVKALSGKADNLYDEWNKLRSNLVMLLAYNRLLVKFKGTMEEYSGPDIVPDNNVPQFKAGYLKPGLIVTRTVTDKGEITRVEPATALVAITVTTTTTTYAEMIGDSVGRAESQ